MVKGRSFVHLFTAVEALTTLGSTFAVLPTAAHYYYMFGIVTLVDIGKADVMHLLLAYGARADRLDEHSLPAAAFGLGGWSALLRGVRPSSRRCSIGLHACHSAPDRGVTFTLKKSGGTVATLL